MCIVCIYQFNIVMLSGTSFDVLRPGLLFVIHDICGVWNSHKACKGFQKLWFLETFPPRHHQNLVSSSSLPSESAAILKGKRDHRSRHLTSHFLLAHDTTPGDRVCFYEEKDRSGTWAPAVGMVSIQRSCSNKQTMQPLQASQRKDHRAPELISHP